MVASVTGTEHDPQVRSRQVAMLREAGVLVAPSNAQAAELAASLLILLRGPRHRDDPGERVPAGGVADASSRAGW